MKKNVFLLMALCLNIFVAYAQKENPRGTYKMTKLTGRGGVEIDAPFDQYKICEEGMTISVFVRPTSEDEAECNAPLRLQGHRDSVQTSAHKSYNVACW